MRLLAVLVLVAPLVMPGESSAQSFGLGGRFGMVRADAHADTGAERFTGGHIRAGLSRRTALEIALDLRTTTSETLTERVREYPLQASLLLFPARGTIGPYLLGGGGWYTRRLETQVDDAWVSGDVTRRFGWHGGFGAELRLGRHAAAHADYRYTFLRFGDDENDPEPRSGFSRLLPAYQGSMWTAGLTLYF